MRNMDTKREDMAGRAQGDLTGKKPRRGRRRRASYKVMEEALLYMIADAGVLDCLRGVKDTPEGKVYYFERVPDVAEIIERYETEKEEFLYG